MVHSITTYMDRMRREEVKKWQNSVHVVVECPPTAYPFKYAAIYHLSINTKSYIGSGCMDYLCIKAAGLKGSRKF